MLVPAFGSLAIFVLCFGPLMWGHSLSQAILKGIEYAWVVPLVQIAFLWYPQKDRFLVQASVCLVISPLFEWGAGFLNFGSFVSLTISFAILGLMSVCALNCARMRE